jgi:cbb3-type cytochrome oxidase subunit 3
MKGIGDVVAGSGLSGYAIGALILFFFAFIVLLIRIYAPSRRAMYDRDSRMPLDDVHPQDPREPGDRYDDPTR